MKADDPKAKGAGRAVAKPRRAIRPIDTYIGQELKARRKAARLSQSALAETVGVAYQQIQKYERGENRISVARLIEIARVLDCKITDFIPEEDR